MPADKSMTRVRKWVQGFYGTDNDALGELAENFECYLNHVKELETGDFEYQSLPNFNSMQKALIHAGVTFGFAWANDTATLYVITDDEGRFLGLYALPENALRAVGESATGDDPVEQAATSPVIRVVSPHGSSPRERIQPLVTSDAELSRQIGENLLFLLDHTEGFHNGDVGPDDFPHLPSNAKWMLAYSALFGRLWEFSHPSLWAVLDANERLVNIYSTSDEADEAAERVVGCSVQRVNVQDGDLPNEVVLGADIGPSDEFQ